MDTAATIGSTPSANGNEGPIERIIREIEELLAPLDARQEQLKAELHDINEERERLKAGIAGLTGALAPQSPPPKAKKRTAGPSMTHGPSQKMLDDVYACVARAARAGEDRIKDEICEELGISQSAAMDSLRTLREQERIRIVGARKAANDPRTGGRGASAYSVMVDG